MENVLTVDNVCKNYGNFTALNNVSLSVPKGSIFGLLGPNGAGKTSLIRIINQITLPDSGRILLDGENLQPHHIQNIGYLPEERGLYKSMKVGEQALYLAQLKGMSYSEAKKKLKYWFEKFEITDWWNKKIQELSKGMAQKVQFVTTVLHEPELLIFDEPFTGFDPINTNLIKGEIQRLNENGATVIFSTHRMESVEEICNHIGLIDNGTVMIEGNLLDIRKHYKDGTFAFTTRTVIDDWGGHEVFLQREDPIGYLTVLKAAEFPKELVISLSQKGELVAFEEVLPTVNDIFIEIVKNGPKPWNHE